MLSFRSFVVRSFFVLWLEVIIVFINKLHSFLRMDESIETKENIQSLIKKRKGSVKEEVKAEPPESITVIVENNKSEDDDNTEGPKTAKDLFSVFKPASDDSDFEYEDGETESESEDSEPIPKKYKKGQTPKASPSKEKPDTEGRKKKHYSQKYKKDWEQIPSLKPWLSESVHGNTYFYCKFCKKDYRCGKSELFKHMASMKHQKHLCKPVLRVQKKFSFRGLLCPVVTPFNKTRAADVNYSLLKPYAKFLKACGVKGVLINDVMGEGMALTIEERKKITEIWAELCKENNQFLMVQIGGAPMKNVIDMAIHAEKLKVGAVVLLPDLYNRPKNHLDLIRYIKLVAEVCNQVPILYHHNPKYTQIQMDVTSFLLDITGEIDSFVGLIYSTNDLQEGLAAHSVNQEKFTVFMGTDEVMLGAVASGFTCIMGNSINILPKLTESICQCIKNGEIKSAQTSQNLLKKALDNIYCNGEPVPTLKAALSIITNLPFTPTRDPLQTVWEGTLTKMKNKLHEIGIV